MFEREEAPGVQDLGGADGLRVVGVEALGGLALDEERVRPDLQDGVHRQAVGLDEVLERRHEGAVGRQLLVPPAVGGREERRDVDLVDRGVELHPGIATGKGGGVT
jgi:hypothetical protein